MAAHARDAVGYAKDGMTGAVASAGYAAKSRIAGTTMSMPGKAASALIVARQEMSLTSGKGVDAKYAALPTVVEYISGRVAGARFATWPNLWLIPTAGLAANARSAAPPEMKRMTGPKTARNAPSAAKRCRLTIDGKATNARCAESRIAAKDAAGRRNSPL